MEPDNEPKTIFNCGADLDGDIFYYIHNGKLLPVYINHRETWLDGYREAQKNNQAESDNLKGC